MMLAFTLAYAGGGTAGVMPRGYVSQASRLQAALDEWRESIQAPGASLGIVTKDGKAIGSASGLAERAALVEVVGIDRPAGDRAAAPAGTY